MAKPSLTLVSPSAGGTEPPRKLGEHGLSLWRAILNEYQIEDRAGIELLAQACAAEDRAEALAAAIAADGIVTRSKTGVLRSHPAVKDELACRAFICRTLERLGLNIEVIKPQGHPTRPTGWMPEED